MRNNIKHYRTKKGWTQKELAKRAELSHWWINHIENGTKSAGMSTFVKVAYVLGVDFTDLFTPLNGENNQKEEAK